MSGAHVVQWIAAALAASGVACFVVAVAVWNNAPEGESWGTLLVYAFAGQLLTPLAIAMWTFMLAWRMVPALAAVIALLASVLSSCVVGVFWVTLI